jgi:hypothetical protein
MHPLLFPVGAAGVGLIIAARAMFRGRSAERRCPGCSYDMHGLATFTCPECGCTAKSEVRMHRGRRKWWMLAPAAVLMAPLVLLQSPRATRWVVNAATPEYERVQRQHFDAATVSIYAPYSHPEWLDGWLRYFGVEYEQRMWGQRAIVTANHHEVLSIDDAIIELGCNFHGNGDLSDGSGINQDLNGDGIPDLVISAYSGGAHCCTTYYFLSLGQKPKLLCTHDGLHGTGMRIPPAGEPGAGTLEIIQPDWTFAYWHECFAGSPSPHVVLELTPEGLRLASERMLKPAPTQVELVATAVSQRDRFITDEKINSDLWRTMLDLMYTGHEREAWAYFDTAWPETIPGKEEFRTEFVAELNTSPYWPLVKSAFTPADPVASAALP